MVGVDPRKLWKHVQQCHSTLIGCIDPEEMLPYLPCLTTSQKEKIRAEQKNNGAQRACQLFIHELERRELSGFKEFVRALRHPAIDFPKVADVIDPQGLVPIDDVEPEPVPSASAVPEASQTVPCGGTTTQPSQPAPNLLASNTARSPSSTQTSTHGHQVIPTLNGPMQAVERLTGSSSAPENMTYLKSASVGGEQLESELSIPHDQDRGLTSSPNFVINAKFVQIGNNSQINAGQSSTEDEFGQDTENGTYRKQFVDEDLNLTLDIDDLNTVIRQPIDDHEETMAKSLTPDQDRLFGASLNSTNGTSSNDNISSVSNVLQSVDIASAGPPTQNMTPTSIQEASEHDRDSSITRHATTCMASEISEVGFGAIPSISLPLNAEDSQQSHSNLPAFSRHSPVGASMVQEQVPIQPSSNQQAASLNSVCNVDEDVPSFSMFSGLSVSPPSPGPPSEAAKDSPLFSQLVGDLGVSLRNSGTECQDMDQETEVKCLHKASHEKKDDPQSEMGLSNLENFCNQSQNNVSFDSKGEDMENQGKIGKKVLDNQPMMMENTDSLTGDGTPCNTISYATSTNNDENVVSTSEDFPTSSKILTEPYCDDKSIESVLDNNSEETSADTVEGFQEQDVSEGAEADNVPNICTGSQGNTGARVSSHSLTSSPSASASPTQHSECMSHESNSNPDARNDSLPTDKTSSYPSNNGNFSKYVMLVGGSVIMAITCIIGFKLMQQQTKR